MNVFKAVFCIFTFIGAVATLDPVINFSDSVIFAMSVPNIIGLYILAKVVRKEVKGFRSRVEEVAIRTYT